MKFNALQHPELLRAPPFSLCFLVEEEKTEQEMGKKIKTKEDNVDEEENRGGEERRGEEK